MSLSDFLLALVGKAWLDLSSRVDHLASQFEQVRLHAIAFFTGTPSPLGSASAGSSEQIARGDHVHAHGDQAGGNLHAAAVAGGDAGFMTGADKAKLDGIEAGADVTDATNVSAAGAVMDSDFSAADGLMRKTGQGTYALLKVNLGANTAPTVGDDVDDGYGVGSLWVHTGNAAYVCLDAAQGSAVWRMIPNMAAPGEIGATTPAAASFTTVDATELASLLGGVRLSGNAPAVGVDAVSEGVVDLDNTDGQAAKETMYEGGGKDRVRLVSTTANNNFRKIRETLTSGSSIALPAPGTNLRGRLIFTANQHAGTIDVAPDGTCAIGFGTINVVVSDIDGSFCVFNNSGTPTIRNRTGETVFVMADYEYCTTA